MKKKIYLFLCIKILSLNKIQCAELPVIFLEPSRQTQNLSTLSIEELEARARDASNPDAQCFVCLKLADAYYQRVDPNHEKARSNFEIAAASLDKRTRIWAWYHLAKIYCSGQWSGKARRWGLDNNASELAKNYALGKGYFDKVVDQESELDLRAKALFDLAELFLEGRAVLANKETALGYFRRAAIQNNDLVVADRAKARIVQLTDSYYASLSIPGSIVAAVSNPVLVEPKSVPLAKAPEQSSEELFALANQQYQARNYVEAYAGFQKIAQREEISSVHPRAWLTLGLMNFLEMGVKKNKDEGLSYYLQAAELGDADVQAEASWFLGELYFQGVEVTRDFGRAFGYFTKAANRASLPPFVKGCAWVRLIECYYKGLGVEKNYAKVREYCELAEQLSILKAGQIVAWFYQGELYFLGLGVPKDESRACTYWRKASEQSLEQCCESAPDKRKALELRAEASLRLARLYLGQKLIDQAEPFFAKSLESKPLTDDLIEICLTFARAYNERVITRPHGPGFEKVTTYYRRAADQQVNPSVSAQAWLELGWFYNQDQSSRNHAVKFAQERDCYQKVIALNREPDITAQALIKLASSFAYNTHLPKDLQKAKECYQKIMSLPKVSDQYLLEAWQGLYNLNLSRPGGPDPAIHKEAEDMLYSLHKRLGVDSMLVRKRDKKP